MKTSELIKLLVESMTENGDLNVKIIRSGNIYPEIELYPGDVLYLEAYKANENQR